MMIRYATSQDYELLRNYDKHVSNEVLMDCIDNNKIIVMFENNNFIGWLRYNFFWDNTPFMNMLYFLDSERGKGYGTKLVEFWENEMLSKGFNIVLTSTQSNEDAQFFYRKRGYKDCGSLILPDEPLEIILFKSFT